MRGRFRKFRGKLAREGVASLTVNVFVEQIIICNGRQAEDNRMSIVINQAPYSVVGSVVSGGSVEVSNSTLGYISSRDIDAQSSALRNLVREAERRCSPEHIAAITVQMKALLEAATPGKLDRKWFDVSADGLIKAAGAVIGLAEPMTKAIDALRRMAFGN